MRKELDYRKPQAVNVIYLRGFLLSLFCSALGQLRVCVDWVVVGEMGVLTDAGQAIAFLTGLQLVLSTLDCFSSEPPFLPHLE